MIERYYAQQEFNSLNVVRSRFLPATMKCHTEILQSEFLTVIILRPLHYLLLIELDQPLQHSPPSCYSHCASNSLLIIYDRLIFFDHKLEKSFDASFAGSCSCRVHLRKEPGKCIKILCCTELLSSSHR